IVASWKYYQEFEKM
ncbi:DUF2972 domain-containing protein, partial [Campylobacter jejuni]|nr:DUF2972 domain-containing protein [Campylobacter jejuni]EMF1273346.1 DUF2972 domain-containing protein [Campylobacter jejuni]